MARSTDVVILGSGFRGLWLAAECVKLGWKTMWIQVQVPQTNRREGGFLFDDWPWQVGTYRPQTKFYQDVKDFIETALKPEAQDLSVQILTPDGPLELSGGETPLALNKFFPRTHKEIADYLQSIHKSQKADEKKGPQLLAAHTKKVFQKPLMDRWVLEWLGSVRNARAVSTSEWVLKWSGQLLDPQNKFLLLQEGFETVVERALKWAEHHGVDVRRQAIVGDIATEGRVARGIELGEKGFVEAQYLVVASSYQTAAKKIPTFARRVETPVGEGTEKWCWIRCGFLMKPKSRPAGLQEFSSFVVDPLMPYLEDNMGLLKWRVTEDGDHLTVWVRIPYAELKRRSYLMNLTERIEERMKAFFPRFARDLKAVLPFDEYFEAPEVGHDDLAITFSGENRFMPAKTKLKNLWIVGPGRDRGLEIFSRLASEHALLGELKELRQKELKKSDRKIHSARDGRDMARP